MYVVFGHGGKQYRAVEGQKLFLERCAYEEGKPLVLNGISFGKEAAACTIEVVPLEEMRGPKLIVFKKRRRTNYRRKKGHRQDLLCVKIGQITKGKAYGS